MTLPFIFHSAIEEIDFHIWTGIPFKYTKLHYEEYIRISKTSDDYVPDQKPFRI